MDKKINVGIIGLGKVGLLRKTLIQKHPSLCLRAVCDVTKPDLSVMAEYRYFEKYQDLLESDVDAVFIATPNRYTPEIVIAALNHNKHVFCEKPPGRTVQDIERIRDAERKSNGCILKFGFNHRYHGAVMEAKKIIDSGIYGKILWIRGVYGKSGGLNFKNEWRSHRESAGGGILLDQGIHMLDLFRYFLGNFSEIKSFVNTTYWDIGVEDNAFALMRNRNNQVAFIHSSSTQWKHTFSLEICLEGGYVNIHGILSSTRSYGQGEKLIVAKKQFEDEAQAIGNPKESVTFFDRDRSWELEIEEFVNCIERRTPVSQGTSMDALEVMKLVHDIYDNDPPAGMTGQ
ncbi:MAG: Gfo/Idh/MocA family oxidoreductase [Methanoregula sp.]|nr:Gfo/Idh/MocA family oxidoreductase [Methanoregula sp.]